MWSTWRPTWTKDTSFKNTGGRSTFYREEIDSLSQVRRLRFLSLSAVWWRLVESFRTKQTPDSSGDNYNHSIPFLKFKYYPVVEEKTSTPHAK